MLRIGDEEVVITMRPNVKLYAFQILFMDVHNFSLRLGQLVQGEPTIEVSCL